MSSVPAPTQQTLAVPLQDGMDPGHAVDNSVQFNQKYRYVLERVASFTLSGKTIDIKGQPSQAIEVNTEDKFAPLTPQGLVAVADTASNAIDLSWTPNGDADLAGYRVYRREADGTEPAQRLATLATESSYRDTGVQAGHRYAYSVSAIDQKGNESARSAETEETLPTP